MSYTFATFKTAIAVELAVSESNVDFNAMLPSWIDYSEQRCYRELDLLTASVTLNGTLTPNDRFFTLPTGSGHILVINGINIFDALNVRHSLMAASRDVIDFLWPSDTAPTTTTIPSLMARVDDTRVLLGPAPGSNWIAEVIATIRPTSLSSGNTTTFLTNYLPDLFLAGAMIAASGFMRNYGAQSDDPKMAVSWEQIFQELMVSAKSEELRKKFTSGMSGAPQ